MKAGEYINKIERDLIHTVNNKIYKNKYKDKDEFKNNQTTKPPHSNDPPKTTTNCQFHELSMLSFCQVTKSYSEFEKSHDMKVEGFCLDCVCSRGVGRSLCSFDIAIFSIQHILVRKITFAIVKRFFKIASRLWKRVPLCLQCLALFDKILLPAAEQLSK